MTAPRHNLWLVRHGQTEWSKSGQHTGRTDLPLTPDGETKASRLAPILARRRFALVLTSPLQRARRTCELAGLGDQAQPDDDLMEWDYGEYEGVTTPQIQQTVPGWSVFTHPCPGGETADDVGRRADRVLERVRAASGEAILFAHGHYLRVLAARFLRFPPTAGQHFTLDTATLNILGHDHDAPAIHRWNAPLVSPAEKGV